MPRFGKVSTERLNTLHPDLKAIMLHAIEIVDFTIVSGHRNEEEQNACCDSTPPTSTLRYPDSRHNSFPSEAVDVCPWSGFLDWENEEKYMELIGVIKGIAYMLGTEITCLNDWRTDDNKPKDRPHVELVQRHSLAHRIERHDGIVNDKSSTEE